MAEGLHRVREQAALVVSAPTSRSQQGCHRSWTSRPIRISESLEPGGSPRPLSSLSPHCTTLC